jgi:glycosyltransferase involved in cell wall biosynthesis
MKILFVYDCVYPESLGGVEYRNHCLARALVERGHEVTVAGWVSGPKTLEDGVATLPMAFRASTHDGVGKRSTVASLKFMAAAARLDVGAYDVIETANIPYIHILPLSLLCALAGKPLVVTWHEHFGPYWRRYEGRFIAFAYQALEFLCAQIGRINAPSPLTAERLQRARFRGGGAVVPVIPNGVWLRDIQEALLSPASDAPPLLYAGRLIPEKRIDLLLQAVAKMKLSSVRANACLLGIVGDGPDRRRLEALVVALDIVPRVKFYGRLPDIADMWRVLAGARIAVQPSAREGFGLFPLEAIALGRPVVTCEAPDNAVGAIVRHNIEGFCTAAEPQALAATLENLLDDEVLWRRMSEAAQRRAAIYDWPAIAGQIEAFFLNLVPPDRLS